MKSCFDLQNIIKSVYNPEKYVFMAWICTCQINDKIK